MLTGKVLVMSDDLNAGAVWCSILKQKNIEGTLLSFDQDSSEIRSEQSIDIVVIDAYTSESQLIELVQNLRGGITIPVLAMISSNHETVVLDIYNAGADECIIKPISPLVFLAKINVWMGRAQAVPTTVLDSYQVGELRLEPALRQLTKFNGENVKLTNLEFRLLHILMSHPNRLIESSVLIDRVWGNTIAVSDAVLVKNVIYRLRRKIEPNPTKPRYIQSVAGEGYMFQS